MVLLASVLAIAGTAVYSAPAGAQSVTRGPYLCLGTPSSVVVRWRTDVATDSRVRFGDAPGNLTQFVDDATSTTEHEVNVAGLSARTSYYYSVGTTATELAGNDAGHRFQTAPPVGNRAAIHVWVVGDFGFANTNAANVRDAFLADPRADETNIWLMLGDNAYFHGTNGDYQSVFDMQSSIFARMVVWPTRGNHDELHSGANNDYYDFFTLPTSGEAGGLPSGTEAYYSFDYGNIHFICLDSQGSSRSPGGAMLTWLAQDLAATSQDWIVAFWHHPPYTKGSHDSDNPSDSGGRMRDMRENALPILEAGGADLVLCGHSHVYERTFLLDGHYGLSSTLTSSMILDAGNGNIAGDSAYLKPTAGRAPHEGTVYVTLGSSSDAQGGPLNHPAMSTSQNRLGSMILDVSGDILEAEFIDDSGITRDRFMIARGMTATEVRELFAMGRSPRLAEAFPNPFEGQTSIPYILPAGGHVRVGVYDVRGRRVVTLRDGFKSRGEHRAIWDGRDARGQRVAPGMYFTTLDWGGRRVTGKIVLMR